MDIMLELRFKRCEYRVKIRNEFTEEVVFVCNSDNICCPLRGGPANPKGNYSPTCNYDFNQ